ncbi:ABC transporter substrate-binding protein [Halobacterium salinarum]|uniref:ABC transporter substrate-binding protein n=1 Tax=Halobacterium salinarum TaxID=2242 RepID=UPI001F1F66BA|nr:ABC transporter substrate-binding protein [Halobacterium salinarum]MCF2238612.1 twin-arginine translocation signal domain-containing protein [Halobacterium salinarum]MDL0138836.1 ABC transporter substrate-binding protein [Halobacterium salinarum]WJK63860.1 ABC transporter substrate-binding protein [Halobacterium salinarum]
MANRDNHARPSRPNTDQSTSEAHSRRRVLKALGATGVAAGVAGCLGGGSDDSAATATSEETSSPDTETLQPENIPRGGTFKVATTSTTNGLNAFRIGDGQTSARVNSVMDAGFSRTGEAYEDILPLWFEDFSVSEPVDQIEITLRDNLEYGNGYGELTADDYLWNLNNLWRPDWTAFTYSHLFNVGADNTPITFEKVDKYTIRETIPEPRPFFPYNEPLGGMYPIPKALAKPYVEAEDADGLEQDEEVMRAAFNGNLGPWDLKRWSQQSVMAFERAEDYYLRQWAKRDDRVPEVMANAPYFDEFHMQYFNKASTAREALKGGEIDRVSIPSTDVPEFRDQGGIELYKNPYRSWSGYLGINHRANGWTQLRNKKVRHAMAHIYHNEFIVENILNGRAGVQNTLHPTWGPYAPENPTTFSGSLDEARRLLKEGTSNDYGYSGDTFVGPDGNQVELTIVYQSGQTDDLRAAYLKKRLGKVGIKLNQETTSWPNLMSNYFKTTETAPGFSGEPGYGDENRQPSDYNRGPQDEAVSAQPWDFMLTLGFDYGPNTPASTITNLFGTEQSFNSYGYAPDRDLAGMRDAAQTAASRDAAKAKITEMLEYLSEERPVIFEYNPYNFYAYNDSVENIPDSPANDYYVEERYSEMYFSDGASGR